MNNSMLTASKTLVAIPNSPSGLQFIISAVDSLIQYICPTDNLAVSAQFGDTGHFEIVVFGSVEDRSIEKRCEEDVINSITEIILNDVNKSDHHLVFPINYFYIK